jgi:hypothetical protein
MKSSLYKRILFIAIYCNLLVLYLHYTCLQYIPITDQKCQQIWVQNPLFYLFYDLIKDYIEVFCIFSIEKK